jgi:hypothetical protein
MLQWLVFFSNKNYYRIVHIIRLYHHNIFTPWSLLQILTSFYSIHATSFQIKYLTFFWKLSKYLTINQVINTLPTVPTVSLDFYAETVAFAIFA